MKPSGQEHQVQHYYDRNTVRFLRLARTLHPRAIHQPLYAAPEMTMKEALHTPHRILLELIPQTKSVLQVLDLGCGVGESVLYLSKKTDANVLFHGITLSGEQVEIARKYVAQERADSRIRIHHGSFQSLPDEIPAVDLAYAIESLVHSSDVQQFFGEVATRLSPGGQRVIFDDFLIDSPDSGQNSQVLSDFRSGWLASTILSADAVAGIANRSGFRLKESRDLSAMLRLNRPRDKFVRLITPLARIFMDRSMYCRFLVGGNARQVAYQKGMLQYCMLRFEKV
jgi:cyclopropane fatty-acyl-phospholipid synthase-like methyltransferase